PARVWIPGCGTGHDAYGIAMLLIERCAAARLEPNFKIFATDADADSIQSARSGYFLDDDMSGISAERRARFFRWRGMNRFQVNLTLRNSVVFATHDLTGDP